MNITNQESDRLRFVCYKVLAQRLLVQCKGNWKRFVDKVIGANNDTDVEDAGEKEVLHGQVLQWLAGNGTMRPVDRLAVGNRRDSG